ncbi:MAG: c-type cytochrome, partial [Planctomycetales bacterium]
MEPFRLRRMKWLLLISSLVCLGMLLLAAFEENYQAEWRTFQHAHAARLAANAKAKGKPAPSYAVEMRQVYLEDLDRVDRCVACHVAIDDPAFADAEQPLRSHPGDWLRIHSSEKFGCTICHQGQGRAVRREDAHGEVPHWPQPMLRGDMVYTSCGRCNYENDLYGGQADLYGEVSPVRFIRQGELDAGLQGADNIARGKQLTAEKGCLGCHKYRGRGGVLGPDVTYVGDKTVHDYSFKRVHGEHTPKNWLFHHFLSPEEVVPSTLMPDMNLTETEAHDLAEYMISLKRKSAPAAYTPLPRQVDATPVRGETLYAMYCSACHGADGVGAIVRDAALIKDAATANRIDIPRELITPSL